MASFRQRAMELLGAAFAAVTAPQKPSRGGTTVIRQASTEAISNWSIDAVRKALDAHERGDFARSALLAEAMGRDDRISACLNTRLLAFASSNGVDFSIEPPEGGDQALADEVEAWWHDVLPDATQRQLLGDVVMIGLAAARLTWSLSGKAWAITKVERWHPANLRWDADKGRFVALLDVGAEEVIEPGDPNWLLITPGGDDSWLCGAVRALGFAYVARTWNWRDWARFNERHGMPLLAIKEPPVNDVEGREAFFQSLKLMGSKGVVRLPQSSDGKSGYDVDYRETRGQSYQTFGEFKAALDTSIAIYLLGQNLTTEVQGGSLAAAKVQDRVRADYLGADAEAMATPERAQIIVPWLAYNRPGADLTQAPWPRWATAAPEDQSALATTIKTFGEAVTAVRNSGVPLDALELANRFKLPLLEGAPLGDVAKPAAPAQAPQDGAPPPKGGKAQAHARGAAQAAGQPGYVSGQLMVDDLADNYRPAAGAALEGTLLGDLLKAIDGATSYDDVRAKVLAAYRDAASPAEVRDLTRKALVLADLGGALAVREDS